MMKVVTTKSGFSIEGFWPCLWKKVKFMAFNIFSVNLFEQVVINMVE